jgi:hypothetical protein
MALACLAANAAGGDNVRKADEGENPGRLVVHEWGTFTNFSGSNGLQLEFRPLLDSDLPAFVYDRAMQSTNPFIALLSKKSYVARQRMETPVTYFYTDRPRTVEARVDFPQGLLTEFYPPVRQMGPAFEKQPARLEKSYLDWGPIRLIPQAEFAAQRPLSAEAAVWGPNLPAVTGDNHYAYARETDSAVVEFTTSRGVKHYEKFLFYRGLGSFTLPLQLQALGQGRFHVTNVGPDAVRSLFLVHVEGKRIFYQYSPVVNAHGSLRLEQSSQESSVDQLGEAVVAALMETGLYEKEARSMDKTWQSSWFSEEGTRLFYLLPARLTDEILPLSIRPVPDEMVRVLVGRMEVVTPEQAARISGAIAELGTCVTLDAEPLHAELAQLGRFAEPALEYLLRSAADPDQRRQLDGLLGEMRQQRLARALK